MQAVLLAPQDVLDVVACTTSLPVDHLGELSVDH